MKQLTSRQAKLLLMFYVIISKVMMLPAIISSYANNDTWIVFLIMFAFEFLFVLLIGGSALCFSDAKNKFIIFVMLFQMMMMD